MGHNESSKEEIEKVARDIDGQALVRAEVTLGETVLEFDLGGRLVLVPNKTDYDDKEKTEQWRLFVPTGYVYTLRADGTYSHHPDDDNSTKTWLSL